MTSHVVAELTSSHLGRNDAASSGRFLQVNTRMRRAAVAVAAAAWPSRSPPVAAPRRPATGRQRVRGTKGDDITVGLLLPENQTARYEKFDKPLIEKKVEELTNGKGKVVYANAKQDADLQAQQVDTHDHQQGRRPDRGRGRTPRPSPAAVKKAKDAGIPVVAYDRLAEGPIDAYTSFDNEEVGQVQGKALLEALGAKAKAGKIVMMNGADHRPERRAVQEGRARRPRRQGEHRQGVRHQGVEAGERQRQHGRRRSPRSARSKIVGVYSANDGMAGGIITALKAAGISPLPPVTGQDAELAGVQRIVAGEQFMSVYKPYAPEADAAAEMAVALAQGKNARLHRHGQGRQPDQQGRPVRARPGRLADQGQHQGHGRQGRRLHRRRDLHRASTRPPATRSA